MEEATENFTFSRKRLRPTKRRQFSAQLCSNIAPPFGTQLQLWSLPCGHSLNGSSEILQPKWLRLKFPSCWVFRCFFFRASTWQIFKYFPSSTQLQLDGILNFQLPEISLNTSPIISQPSVTTWKEKQNNGKHNTELKGKLFSLFCSPTNWFTTLKRMGPALVLFLCGSLYLEINAIRIVVVHSSRKKKKSMTGCNFRGQKCHTDDSFASGIRCCLSRYSARGEQILKIVWDCYVLLWKGNWYWRSVST